MKNESQSSRGPVFYLATENLGFSLFRRYRIQEKMMEGKNFVPEAMMIHSFQKEPYHDRNGVGFRGEVRMPELELMTGDVIGPAYLPEFDGMIPFVRFQDEGDKDDKDDKDDWDEDEEDWDEDDSQKE